MKFIKLYEELNRETYANAMIGLIKKGYKDRAMNMLSDYIKNNSKDYEFIAVIWGNIIIDGLLEAYDNIYHHYPQYNTYNVKTLYYVKYDKWEDLPTTYMEFDKRDKSLYCHPPFWKELETIFGFSHEDCKKIIMVLIERILPYEIKHIYGI